jgi:uncharacterized protein YndB with AHSA1/START domain
MVVNEGGRIMRREIDIDAPPEEVWEAVSTEEGRERWLDEDAGEVHVEAVDPPSRLVWWCAAGDPPAFTRVELEIVAVPAGSRVVVVESAPSFPLTTLAASFSSVVA